MLVSYHQHSNGVLCSFSAALLPTYSYITTIDHPHSSSVRSLITITCDPRRSLSGDKPTSTSVPSWGTMIPPIPLLCDYEISPHYGFLPMELPLKVLPDPYYNRWDAVIGNLQALLLSRRLRGVVDRLPVLSTSRLQHPAEWRRAYHVLAFMTHAYIWGGDKPEEVRGPPDSDPDVMLIRLIESTTTNLNPVPQNLQTP